MLYILEAKNKQLEKSLNTFQWAANILKHVYVEIIRNNNKPRFEKTVFCLMMQKQRRKSAVLISAFVFVTQIVTIPLILQSDASFLALNILTRLIHVHVLI